MAKKARIDPELEALQRRLDALEYQRFKETHEHLWRYSKHVTVYPKGSFNPGRALFWSWECIDEECKRHTGSNGTNAPGHLPGHFPDDLR